MGGVVVEGDGVLEGEDPRETEGVGVGLGVGGTQDTRVALPPLPVAPRVVIWAAAYVAVVVELVTMPVFTQLLPPPPPP